MLCGRCNSENSAGARYCNSCGSTLDRACPRCGARVASIARFCEACGAEVTDENRAASPLTPRADKEFEKPTRVVDSKPRHTSGSISEGRLDLRHIPTDQPSRPPQAAPSPKSWQWALAIGSAAVFLYTSSFAISLGLISLRDKAIASGLANQLGIYVALAGAACCGVALALADKKTSLTAIVGALTLRATLAIALAGQGARPFIAGWLGIFGFGAAILWWLWLGLARERGDATRMSIALTVLVAAEALSAAFGFAMHPPQAPLRYAAILAIVIGSLLWLRVWIPSAIGDGRR